MGTDIWRRMRHRGQAYDNFNLGQNNIFIVIELWHSKEVFMSQEP